MKRITYLYVILHVKHNDLMINDLMTAKMTTEKVVTSQASSSATTDKVYLVL